jgi:hypothetical protein
MPAVIEVKHRKGSNSRSLAGAVQIGNAVDDNAMINSRGLGVSMRGARVPRLD